MRSSRSTSDSASSIAPRPRIGDLSGGIQVHLQRGDRRAQLMGGVGAERPFPLDQSAEALGGAVQGGGGQVELADARPAARTEKSPSPRRVAAPASSVTGRVSRRASHGSRPSAARATTPAPSTAIAPQAVHARP